MLNNCFVLGFFFRKELTSVSAHFFSSLKPEVLFNDIVELLDETSFVLGEFLSLEEINICFFLWFLFNTLNGEMII